MSETFFLQHVHFMIILVFDFSFYRNFHFGFGSTRARLWVAGGGTFNLASIGARKMTERRVSENAPCLTHAFKRRGKKTRDTLEGYNSCGAHDLLFSTESIV